MQQNKYVLIDIENIHVSIDQLYKLLDQTRKVFIVFAHSPRMFDLNTYADLLKYIKKDKLDIIKMCKVGKNSADFGLSFIAGRLSASMDINDSVDIISNDAMLINIVGLLNDYGFNAVQISEKNNKISEYFHQNTKPKLKQKKISPPTDIDKINLSPIQVDSFESDFDLELFNNPQQDDILPSSSNHEYIDPIEAFQNEIITSHLSINSLDDPNDLYSFSIQSEELLLRSPTEKEMTEQFEIHDFKQQFHNFHAFLKIKNHISAANAANKLFTTILQGSHKSIHKVTKCDLYGQEKNLSKIAFNMIFITMTYIFKCKPVKYRTLIKYMTSQLNLTDLFANQLSAYLKLCGLISFTKKITCNRSVYPRVLKYLEDVVSTKILLTPASKTISTTNDLTTDFSQYKDSTYPLNINDYSEIELSIYKSMRSNLDEAKPYNQIVWRNGPRSNIHQLLNNLFKEVCGDFVKKNDSIRSRAELIHYLVNDLLIDLQSSFLIIHFFEHKNFIATDGQIINLDLSMIFNFYEKIKNMTTMPVANSNFDYS
ncbi:MAG: PIN domain-containing protein [Acinetobacter sp.]|uniref:PIN domain-containing protein n=1 Tax=Acinetobacter sp. TaxID=472 RepID=UPI002639B559|nr:PIN domain-containing protein [Acinetobacter sp.]MDD2944333.1 PIN domain-containing protein [Acinetobacter sp.]